MKNREASALFPANAQLPAPVCPVDRMPRRRRNKICIAIMALGALNFLIYTIIYAGLGGDARNGSRRLAPGPGGEMRSVYYLRGHHLRNIAGQESEVSRGVWIYSYLHSISLPITASAMIISMLVLARPHIIATMRNGLVSGELFVSAFATVVVVITLIAVTLFAWDFVQHLRDG
jgi:hypothetical protein